MLEDGRQEWFGVAPELQANPKGTFLRSTLPESPRNKGKARKADKKVRTIAGRLVRDVERKLGGRVNLYQNELKLYKRVLDQKKNDKHKIYSQHDVDVQCISKGKAHKQYEFGNKVSITRTGAGVIVGALSFRNEFDGHTLDEAIEQVEKLTQRKPRNGICDRGVSE